MSLDDGRLDIQGLVFLFDFLLNFGYNLINKVVDMSATFRSADGVDKRNLFKLPARKSNNHFPSLAVDILVSNSGNG